MPKFTAIHFSHKSDNWNTPTALFQALDAEFQFNFDPCPANAPFDGLSTSWGTRTYCNPPYSQLRQWLAKGWEEAGKGKTVVFLVPSRTDTKAWHEYAMHADEIRFIRGRLKFGGSKNSAPFPSAIVIFRPRGRAEHAQIS